MFNRTLSVLTLTACALIGGSADAAGPPPAPASESSAGVSPTPESLDAAVEFALRLEQEGRNTDRNALLLKVLEDDPNHPAANWHLGRIKVGDAWVTYDRAIHEDEERWSKVFLYRQNRDEREDSLQDHFFLADGARSREMWDEERVHLLKVVELDWNNREARQRLGHVMIDGGWVSRDEMAQFVADLQQTRRDRAVWAPIVEPIVQRMFRARPGSRQRGWELAAAELNAIRDPAAIPAVEAAFAAGDERGVEWYFDWLSQLPHWEASVALARQAALSPTVAVRAQAQLKLRDRPIDDFGQTLLGAMRGDPAMESRLFITPGGGLMYVQQMAFEKQDEYRVRNLTVIYGPENVVSLGGIPVGGGGPGSPVRSSNTMTAIEQHLRQYYGALTAEESRAATADVQVGSDRLVRAFASVVERDDLESAQECWNWWIDYQQVFAGEKPLNSQSYEETWAVDQQRGYWLRVPLRQLTRSPLSIFQGSCFSAKTPVITEHGPRPIEEIKLGDCVLAQNVETGEIAFKPVLDTTVRPPVELVKVTTNSGDLLCTAGHPFWVNGVDWLYARELQPGMRFHGPSGGVEVLGIEDADRKEQAYNLIVADFHTYFAGETPVLSHDNTPRRPTNALVPGLQPDWSADVGADAVADKQ